MIRLAEEHDRLALRAFRCLPEGLDDEEEPDDVDHVEGWINDAALDWSTDPNADDPRLIVMEEDGRLVGVAAHEGSVEPVFGRFVLVVAIGSLYHDNRFGRALLSATLRDCAERAPGAIAHWLVRRSNEPSVRMCGALGKITRTEEGETYGGTASPSRRASRRSAPRRDDAPAL